MKIFIDKTLLSDKSEVYAVRLDRTDANEQLKWDMVSSTDAEIFAEALNDLVNEHTTDVCVRY